jgi:YfiH family protein
VHGPTTVVVREPGQHAGAAGDAAVTATPGCALAVRTADCAPIVLVGERSIGVVHAGWRGLAEGVVAGAVAAMAELGDHPADAHLGPCIRPGCYEFGDVELAVLTARFGPGVRSTTGWGTPALDLPAAVAAALDEVGVGRLHDGAGCTACDRRWFSHRARGEAARIATIAWIDR